MNRKNTVAQTSNSALCPCSSGKNYESCCKPYHEGMNIPNALTLMRSRYSAYALGFAKYIIDTTHPQGSTFQEDKEKWLAEILEFSRNTTFEKLQIINFSSGKKIAHVTFLAHLFQNGKNVSFCEKSRFEKAGNKWLYHSGTISKKSHG